MARALFALDYVACALNTVLSCSCSSMNLKGAKHSATKKKRDKYLCVFFETFPRHFPSRRNRSMPFNFVIFSFHSFLQLLAAHRHGLHFAGKQLQVSCNCRPRFVCLARASITFPPNRDAPPQQDSAAVQRRARIQPMEQHSDRSSIFRPLVFSRRVLTPSLPPSLPPSLLTPKCICNPVFSCFCRLALRCR